MERRLALYTEAVASGSTDARPRVDTIAIRQVMSEQGKEAATVDSVAAALVKLRDQVSENADLHHAAAVYLGDVLSNAADGRASWLTIDPASPEVWIDGIGIDLSRAVDGLASGQVGYAERLIKIATKPI